MAVGRAAFGGHCYSHWRLLAIHALETWGPAEWQCADANAERHRASHPSRYCERLASLIMENYISRYALLRLGLVCFYVEVRSLAALTF